MASVPFQELDPADAAHAARAGRDPGGSSTSLQGCPHALDGDFVKPQGTSFGLRFAQNVVKGNTNTPPSCTDFKSSRMIQNLKEISQSTPNLSFLTFQTNSSSKIHSIATVANVSQVDGIVVTNSWATVQDETKIKHNPSTPTDGTNLAFPPTCMDSVHRALKTINADNTIGKPCTSPLLGGVQAFGDEASVNRRIDNNTSNHGAQSTLKRCGTARSARLTRKKPNCIKVLLCGVTGAASPSSPEEGPVSGQCQQLDREMCSVFEKLSINSPPRVLRSALKRKSSGDDAPTPKKSVHWPV